MGPLGKRGGEGAGGRAEEEPAAVTWVCASSTPQALMFHALFFMHVRQKVMKQRFLKKKKKEGHLENGRKYLQITCMIRG